MKNRKTLVVSFLLVVALLLGVGYAALSDTLDITGTADIDRAQAEASFNEDVYFSKAVANDDGNTASVNTDNNDKASFTASNLKGQGDKATFTFSIVNVGDVDAIVTPKIQTNTQDAYFKIYSDWNGQPTELDAGTTADAPLTYTVTVELLQTPTETLSGSFLIELTAVSVD